uniref:Ovule protein n=1 Tax=Parascaris equorum TaxID=6256 RepID=A0A914REI3_PAREQ
MGSKYSMKMKTGYQRRSYMQYNSICYLDLGRNDNHSLSYFPAERTRWYKLNLKILFSPRSDRFHIESTNKEAHVNI